MQFFEDVLLSKYVLYNIKDAFLVSQKEQSSRERRLVEREKEIDLE